MEVALKSRAKITVILDTKKVIFSGAKKDAQIIQLGCGVEVRANKLAGAFRFRATGYRTQELTFAQIIEKDYKITLKSK